MHEIKRLKLTLRFCGKSYNRKKVARAERRMLTVGLYRTRL